MANRTEPMTKPISFVREVEIPRRHPPPGTVGLKGWVKQNLFYSAWSSLLTLVLLSFVGFAVYKFLDWALFRAAFTGDSGEACKGTATGACWPFVKAKFGQWIYGFYPFDQRWRVNIVFVMGVLILTPLLMPRVKHKVLNAAVFLVIYPLFAFILLSGGHFAIQASSFLGIVAVMLVSTIFLPTSIWGVETGVKRNRVGFWLILLGLVPLLLAVLVVVVIAGLGMVDIILGWLSASDATKASLATVIEKLAAFDEHLSSLDWLKNSSMALIGGGAALSLLMTLRAGALARLPLLVWFGLFSFILLALWLLTVNFGLSRVDTPQWGGLLVTLVVAIVGIVVSLPLGILLALGRRSTTMPAVKYFCITFIEVWRGVPLVTVLFMASVLITLFLPPGTYFDKLSRALVAVALFSSAYMAEVVRGGLQAIPKGQVEAAQALGLSYWQTMGFIVLPQALKIVIPGIVNTFIGLFKDTTLVMVVGVYDLLMMVVAGFADAKWASPQTSFTGYFVAACIYWIFCFSMSRYSQYIERRLDTGYKR